MLKYFAPLVLCVALLSADCALRGDSVTAEPSTITAIAGTYAGKGKNPDTTSYTLDLRIQTTPDNKAYLEYTFGGKIIAIGIGIRTDDVLSVIFQTSEGVMGISSFRVEKANTGVRLVGEWALPGLTGKGTEQFDRTSAIPEVKPSTAPTHDHGTIRL